MSNLTPQVRPDKNGKLVTRHVKADSLAPPAKAVPAPLLSAAKPSWDHDADLLELTDAIDSALATGAFEDTVLADRKVLHYTLHQMAPSVAAAFRQQIDDEPDVGYEDLLISVLHNKLDTKDASYILFAVQHQQQDGIEMDNYWEDDLEGTIEYENAFKYFRGTKRFAAQIGYSLPDNIFEADEKVRREIGGVIKMLSTGHTLDLPGIVENDWSVESICFSGTELGKLAMERPDDTKRIVEIIKERGLEDDTDMNSIRMVLDAEVQQLSSGLL